MTDGGRTFLNFLVVLAGTMVVLSGITLAWNFHGSDHYIKPDFWKYDETTGLVTFKREVPKTVIGQWAHEIVTTGGLTCAASGVTFYESDADVVQFNAPEELRECLESGEDYSAKLSWTVRFLGTIPLKPVELHQTFTLNPPALEREVKDLKSMLEELRQQVK